MATTGAHVKTHDLLDGVPPSGLLPNGDVVPSVHAEQAHGECAGVLRLSEARVTTRQKWRTHD